MAQDSVRGCRGNGTFHPPLALERVRLAPPHFRGPPTPISASRISSEQQLPLRTSLLNLHSSSEPPLFLRPSYLSLPLLRPAHLLSPLSQSSSLILRTSHGSQNPIHLWKSEPQTPAQSLNAPLSLSPIRWVTRTPSLLVLPWELSMRGTSL